MARCAWRILPALLLMALVPTVSTAATVAGAAPPPPIAQFKDWVTAVAFSPLDGSLASVGEKSLLYRPGDVKLWNPADGKLKQSLEGQGSPCGPSPFPTTAS